MRFKIKSTLLTIILGFFSITLASQDSIDNDILKGLQSNDVEIIETNEINEDGTEFKTTVQLIPKKHKEKIISDKIEFLKKDIAMWKERKEEMIKIKNEYERKLDKNKDDIVKLKNDVDRFNKDISKFEISINEEIKEIDVGNSLMKKDSEVIVVEIGNGKKIRLIKYIVFPRDTLSEILTRTLVENDNSNSTLSHKIETVIKLNKNIKNADSIKTGDIIYIPFFK